MLHRIPVSPTLHHLMPIASNGPSDWQAIVTEVITPSTFGWVKFQGVLWRAVCPQNLTLLPGTTVYVVDRQRLRLVVELNINLESDASSLPLAS